MIANSKLRLFSTLYLHERLPLLYVSNAKAACSTIKKSIWASTDPESAAGTTNFHSKAHGPFASNLFVMSKHLDRMSAAQKFTVVRNPYARCVSAYKDKVLRQKRDAQVWGAISKRYGFATKSRPSLRDVLECVKMDDPNFVDQHFAPQTRNVSLGVINFDHIFHLEDMGKASDFLTGHGVSLSVFDDHKTNATEGIEEFLGREECKLIEEIFSDDFEAFNYERGLSSFAPKKAVQVAPVAPDMLPNLVKVSTTRARAEFEKSIQTLKDLGAPVDLEWTRLDANFAGEARVVGYYEKVKAGEEYSWIMLAKIASALIDNDFYDEAVFVLQKASEVRPDCVSKNIG